MSNDMSCPESCPIPKKKMYQQSISHVSKARSKVFLIELWDDWHELANRNVTLMLVGTCTELLEKLGRGYQWKLALYVYGFVHREDGFISFQQITHCFVSKIGWAAVFSMEVSFSWVGVRWMTHQPLWRSCRLSGEITKWWILRYHSFENTMRIPIPVVCP